MAEWLRTLAGLAKGLGYKSQHPHRTVAHNLLRLQLQDICHPLLASIGSAWVCCTDTQEKHLYT